LKSVSEGIVGGGCGRLGCWVDMPRFAADGVTPSAMPLWGATPAAKGEKTWPTQRFAGSTRARSRRSECALPVGGRELAITVVRSDPNPIVPGNCTAVHGDRRVSCDALMADYGHASHSVRITDSLRLTEAEPAAWRGRMPWWRTSEGLVRTGALLTGLLALVMGGIAFLVGGRFSEFPRRQNGEACRFCGG
jgi:hypothetical protein